MWAGLPPDVLQACVGIEELEHEAINVLDTMYRSQLSTVTNLAYLLRLTLPEIARSFKRDRPCYYDPALGRCPERILQAEQQSKLKPADPAPLECAHGDVVIVNEAGSETIVHGTYCAAHNPTALHDNIDNVMAHVGIHQHCPTCFKSASIGHFMCRLCFPCSCTNNGSQFVEVVAVDDEAVGRKPEPVAPVMAGDVQPHPWPVEDNRLLVFETERPIWGPAEPDAVLTELLTLLAEANMPEYEPLQEKLKSLHDTDRDLFDKIVEVLKTFNGAVVTSNPMAANLIRVNQASYCLGCGESARCILFYLIKYPIK